MASLAVLQARHESNQKMAQTGPLGAVDLSQMLGERSNDRARRICHNFRRMVNRHADFCHADFRHADFGQLQIRRNLHLQPHDVSTGLGDQA